MVPFLIQLSLKLLPAIKIGLGRPAGIPCMKNIMSALNAISVNIFLPLVD